MNQAQKQAVEAMKAPIQKERINPKEVYSKMGKYIKYKRSDIKAFLNASRVMAVAS